MGAVFGALWLMLTLSAMVAVVYALWSILTLAKYALYRILRLGGLSIREYFKIYYRRFSF